MIAVALAAISFFAFSSLGSHQYVSLDDQLYIADNAFVRDGLATKGTAWAFSTLKGGNWHPLTWLSHMVAVEVLGVQPGVHHLVNLGIHVASTLLLWLFWEAATGSTWAAALVAVLFGVHPLHVESVAWISERKDVLSGLLLALALLAYLRGVRATGRPSLLRVGAIFCFGLMAKPMLVTLPFLLLLLDYWPLARLLPQRSAPPGHAIFVRDIAPFIVEKTPLFLLSALSSAITLYAQKRADALASIEVTGLGDRAANALLSYLIYLRKTAWPEGLSVFYPYDSGGVGLPVLIGCFMLLAAATGAVIAARRRRPYLAVGWLWYLGMLIPVIGLVQVGPQARADRYTYLPLVGIFLVVAWASREFLVSRRAMIAGVFVAFISLGTFAAMTGMQASFWQDNLSLFRHGLEVSPDEPMSLKNVGIALAALGRQEEADRYLARAYELNPALRARSYYNAGRRLTEPGKHAEAVPFLRQAVQLFPSFTEASEKLERLLAEHPDLREAGGGGQKTPQAPATAADAHRSIASSLARGDALARIGRFEDAIEAYREAIRASPADAAAYNNLGCALATLGRKREARTAFQEALRLQPDFLEAKRNLARSAPSGDAAGSPARP